MPSSSSCASRSARLDDEIPNTATIAAMPIAMPSAVSADASPAAAQAERADRQQVAEPQRARHAAATCGVRRDRA